MPMLHSVHTKTPRVVKLSIHYHVGQAIKSVVEEVRVPYIAHINISPHTLCAQKPWGYNGLALTTFVEIWTIRVFRRDIFKVSNGNELLLQNAKV